MKIKIIKKADVIPMYVSAHLRIILAFSNFFTNSYMEVKIHNRNWNNFYSTFLALYNNCQFILKSKKKKVKKSDIGDS